MIVVSSVVEPLRRVGPSRGQAAVEAVLLVRFGAGLAVREPRSRIGVLFNNHGIARDFKTGTRHALSKTAR